jgi:uncharacterized protein YhfF
MRHSVRVSDSGRRDLRFWSASPLPPIRRDHLIGFWQRYLAAQGLDPVTPIPDVVEPFGDSAELADELMLLVVRGTKTATAGALSDFDREGLAPPEPGAISVATDGAGRARAVLRTTEVRVGPLTSIDEQFAWDEGEGLRTRDWWLAAHERFFRRYLPTLGVEFDAEMMTIFERFEVLYTE